MRHIVPPVGLAVLWSSLLGCGSPESTPDTPITFDAPPVDTSTETDAPTGPMLLGATGCPSIAGMFDCPARGGQPAFRLVVTEFDDGETANYLFDYGDDVVSYRASRAGVVLDGIEGFCREWMGRPSFAFGAVGGPYSNNYLDEDGNYRVDLTTLTCPPAG